jgi:hypothetical protein
MIHPSGGQSSTAGSKACPHILVQYASYHPSGISTTAPHIITQNFGTGKATHKSKPHVIIRIPIYLRRSRNAQLHGVDWAIPGRRVGGETRAPEGCAGAGGEVEDLEVSDVVGGGGVRLVGLGRGGGDGRTGEEGRRGGRRGRGEGVYKNEWKEKQRSK